MRWISLRIPFTVFVVAFLLAGCSGSGDDLERRVATLEQRLPSDVQPLTVLAVRTNALGGDRASDSVWFTIEYQSPSGESVEWTRFVDGSGGAVFVVVWECFRRATVGEPLPECARKGLGELDLLDDADVRSRYGLDERDPEIRLPEKETDDGAR